MKKIILFLGSMALCAGAIAQPVIAPNRGNVKFSDAVKQYNDRNHLALQAPDEKQKSNTPWDVTKLTRSEKDRDYHLDRWKWYWQRHLDDNGNMVSPAATWKEWKKYNYASKHSGNRTTSSALTWTFQGPDSSGAFTGDGAGSGVGRINVVGFHPTDSNTFCIGAPGGGAWKTTNNGASWTCLTDQLPNLSVADIKFNPLNPNTIYLCSGDRDGRDYYGIGVLKSYDGGNTWNTTGMVWADSLLNIANCILINPLDTNSLILGTSAGMYRSFNGGNSWSLVSGEDFIQLLYRPNDTNIVYAATTSMSATSAQIFRSSNGGSTWAPVTTFTGYDRVAIAVTPANRNMVKALTSTTSGSNPEGLGAIYNSSDTGHTFTAIYTGNCSGHDLLGWDALGTDCSGQGWYDLPIAISPLDSNKVYIGGVNAWTSNNGGTAWSILNQWSTQLSTVISVHADKHFMAFNPLSPRRLFETNDGGVYSSYNASSSSTWQNLTNGLGITEFYSVSVSSVASFAIAGAQDVGTKLVNHGLYEEADGGDGMVALLDFADITTAYASSEGGYIDILDPTAVQPDLTANDISANIAGGSIEGTGAWVTPYILEPSCHTCIIAGYQSVYRSTNKGSTWSAISGSLSGNNLNKVVTTAADSNTIYATEDATGSVIHYTHNMGSTWSTLTTPFGSKYLSDIKVDPRDKDHIWVTFSGYGPFHMAEWTLSGGWQLFDAGLPDVPVHCVAINHATREMFAGTEIGVFYRDSTMSSWVFNSNGMPAVSVTDIEINYGAGEIWASTYGRSLWRALIPTAINIVPFVADGISVAPNPNKGNFSVTLKNIADKNVDMRLIDIMSKTVWQQNNMLNSGSPLQVNTAELSAGTYFLEVSANGGVAGRQKLVIAK